MSFERCAGFSIEGGNFNAVEGTQNVYHIRGDLLQSLGCKGESTNLRQYQEVPVGKVYLKRRIAETTVKRRDMIYWRRLEARRTIHVARVQGEDKEEEFLYVQYTGPDAVKAYKYEFDTFSTVKDTNYLQLFGYTGLNTLPALVFYDAPVPVSHVWERNRFSSILFTYFSYQAVMVQGIDHQTSVQELWTDPRTGLLRKGPDVKHSSNIDHQLAYLPNQTTLLPKGDYPSLPIQVYDDAETLFKYLAGTLSAENVITGIRLSNRATLHWPNNVDARLILSSLSGTVCHRTSYETIARYPGSGGRWSYEPWQPFFTVPNTMRGSRCSIENGAVRFMLTLSDAKTLKHFELGYILQPWTTWNVFADSWLSQAHVVLSQLGIQVNQLGDYSILDDLYLHFERVHEEDVTRSKIRNNIPLDTPIYLFIRPIPRPFDDENQRTGQPESTRYYWSFDDSGARAIPDDNRRNMGLPLFKTTILVCFRWWGRDAYDVMQMVHLGRGFGPRTVKLATSIGYPILEVSED